MADNLLLLDGIGLTVGSHPILQDIDLAVRRGEIHALVGANGSGKSSLALLVMGCSGYAPSRGTLSWEGQPIVDEPMHERARRGITLAWQEPARFEGIRVDDYLSLGEREVDPERALEHVGLDPDRYLSRFVDKSLSGGERKRIELAAVVALKPRLAILDEPAAGVDLVSIDEVVRVIRWLKGQGSAVLLITHREDVAACADRASQLCGGRIVCSGDTGVVIERYKERACFKCDGEMCRHE